MNEIISKLKNVAKSFNSEGQLGKIVLFALIKRSDLENKWYILIGADKLKKNNSEDDLIYVIEKLKSEFNSDLSFISQILLFVREEDVIKDFARALTKIHVSEGEVMSLKLTPNVTIEMVQIIESDFEGLDLGLPDITRVESGPKKF